MAEKKEDANKPTKKPLDLMLIMHLAFAVVNIAVVGAGAMYVYKSTLGWDPVAIREEQLAAEKAARELASVAENDAGPLVYTMEKFTVNLDGEPKRAIRIELNLEMLNKDGFEEVINSENRARARDRIVRMLNEKNFSELESIQGKLFLKDRIAMEINSILDKGVVKDVYFSEFVVQ